MKPRHPWANEIMDTTLVRAPVYQQLNERLREALTEKYRRGDQFLTEREISESFQVSRATANKALASLVSAGWLEFRKGLGTFVRRDVMDYDVRALVSFTEKAKAAGKVPSTKVLKFALRVATEVAQSVQQALATDGATEVWEFNRVRLADETPVILEHRYVVRRYSPGLTRSIVNGSLFNYWSETCQLTVSGANEVIRAVLLTRTEARHLHVAPNSPALEVVSVGFLADQSPLWFERTLYRGDQYEFHSRLGPIQSATPVRGVLR